MESPSDKKDSHGPAFASIAVKESVSKIVERKFGTEYEQAPLMTMIGFAFLRQIVNNIAETLPEDGEAQAPMVFSAVQEMGLPKVAKNTDKRDRRFRHRRKMDALESLRKDPEIGVTCDAFIEFARSLVSQGADDQELAALKKKPPNQESRGGRRPV